MGQGRTQNVARQAGSVAGRAFADGFNQEMRRRQIRQRGRRVHSDAELARLNRALAAHRGRFA